MKYKVQKKTYKSNTRLNDKGIAIERLDKSNIELNDIKAYYNTLNKRIKLKDDKIYQVLILGKIEATGEIKTIKSFGSDSISYSDNYQGSQALDDYDPALSQFSYVEFVIRSYPKGNGIGYI